MDVDRDALLAEDIERAASWVRKLAKKRGIRPTNLGPMSGVNRSTMFSLLREQPCTLRTLTYAAASLGVRARDLLADIPDGPEVLEHRSRLARRTEIGVWDGEWRRSAGLAGDGAADQHARSPSPSGGPFAGLIAGPIAGPLPAPCRTGSPSFAGELLVI